MKIRLSRILLASACVLGLCLAGLVHARSVAAAGSDVAATISPTTGIIKTTFNITIKSNLPSSDTIACEVTLTVTGEDSTFREVAARQGTRSGNSATCIAPIPYSWLLQHPGTDTINLTYEVVIPPETSPTVSLPYRDSVQSGTITPIPANGATTDVTIAVTM
jgi:hypothetical protein